MNQVMMPVAPANNTIGLGKLIDFILQRTYHELTVLAELLPRKTDMERKIEIVQFASRTRQLFIRLLALVKWAASASKVEKCAHIMNFLDKQSMLFVEMADQLSVMSRETLVNARLPSFHLPCAVEVLTLGTYSRLPTCIRDKIVPPDPITPAEKRSTLLRLNQIIQYRLVSSELPPQMRNLTIENGRVTFYVEHEFEVSLTLMGDSPLVSWRLLDINVLVEDKETGDGEALVHSLQVNYIHQLIQSRLIDNPKPLHELYNCLHSFCQSLQLEVLHSQVVRLCRERLRDVINVDEYTAGNRLVLSYWRFPKYVEENYAEYYLQKDHASCKLCVQMDPSDPSKPLQVSHVPPLNQRDSQLADQAIKSDFLSVEKLLIHTVHIRTKHKLQELSETLKPILGISECFIKGSPALLHVPILQPSMACEEMLIAVNTHTGHFLAHISEYDPPMMESIQNCLNKDPSKIESFVSDLRYWITVRRCEKTIQHLPAAASEHLPLIIPPQHELNSLPKHKLFIQLCRHQEYYIVVSLIENTSNRCEILPTYYLMTVQPTALEDDLLDTKVATVMETEMHKTYLKIVDFSSLDNFISTHGPGTEIENEFHGVGLKRKIASSEHGFKRPSHSPFYMSELAHIIAMCDERIPYTALCRELNKRGVSHNGLQIEAHGSNYQIKIVELPVPDKRETVTFNALHQSLLCCTIRLNGKGSRTWFVEFVFSNCPVTSVCPKEQGYCRSLHFTYDFGVGTVKQVAEMVNEMLTDWCIMGHLYKVVLDFAQELKSDQHMFPALMEIKSFAYKRLVLGYGPNKANMVNICWNPKANRYDLGFGIVGQTVSANNPHTIVQAKLQHEFNQHLSIMTLMQALHETFAPLLSINKLPTTSELGVIHSRPAVPIQTFVTIPQTSTHFRIIYRSMFCLDVECRPEGMVAIRDGAYSVFDKQKAFEELSTISNIKAFLSKFVDETATQARRRSQTEDDNPLSPVPALESIDSGFLSVSGQVKPGSPAQCRSQESVSSTGGPGSGLRFHLPMTPPSGSNPHTPASPHTSVLSQQSYGASPNPSFSLASPPSLSSTSQAHVSPSPSMLHVQAQSPGNLFTANSPANPLHVPSPQFLPTASPSSASQVPMQSPAGFINQQAHDGGSPFPASSSTGNLSMSSPAPGAWPGSPSVPRPSPRPTGMAQSPGSSSHPAMHSPQAGGLVDHSKAPGVATTQTSRILHCSWQAGTPTLLTHKSFDQLCSPGVATGIQPGMPQMGQAHQYTSPLERFLGSCYMRKTLGRVIQSENMAPVPTNEVGVMLFKAESLQCRVTLNPQTLQSLHLKLAPNPDHKDQWSPEELQVIERYFDAKVVSIPYKPNALLAFGRILNAPLKIFKDLIHIMHLEMAPDRSLKWAIQLCLTIPPAAPQIAPPGMSAIVMVKDRMLFFAQLTRIGLNLAPGIEPQTVVFAAVYDIQKNTTTVPDRRDPMPISPTDPVFIITNMLKRFAEYNQNSTECSIRPAIRELLTNLVVPIQ